MKFESTSFVSVPAAVLIGSFAISLSILVGSGVVTIKGLKKPSPAPSAQVAAPQPNGNAPSNAPVKVAMEDNPVLGDKNAPVTMIEFSDYECPFCKRYFEQTYPDLKKNYIDTGKMKLVFRNLPLSFHQNAHKEAEAALCARDQGGDGIYFKFHDEVFTRTTSNGTGLALDQLPVIAKDLGLNGQALQSCIEAGKYKERVDKDLADAAKVGANGTPTFFIGKSDTGGVITGTPIVGAQPYSNFTAVIDQQLGK